MATGARTGLLVAVVVAVQVLVPATSLLDPGLRPFGWQMYAGRVSVTSVHPLDEDGEVVDVGRWNARLRPDAPWEGHAPAFLCDRSPEVFLVRLSRSDGTQADVLCSTA